MDHGRYFWKTKLQKIENIFLKGILHLHDNDFCTAYNVSILNNLFMYSLNINIPRTSHNINTSR